MISLTHMHDVRLRIDYQHLSLRQERRRDHAYRYLILIISRLIGLLAIPSIIVDILCILSVRNCTLNVMSLITDYVAAHLVSKRIRSFP